MTPTTLAPRSSFRMDRAMMDSGMLKHFGHVTVAVTEPAAATRFFALLGFEKGQRRDAEWTAHVHETAARLLPMQVDSWMTGVNKNVAGRHKRTFMAYAGGAPKYRQKCDEVVALGYEGFTLA